MAIYKGDVKFHPSLTQTRVDPGPIESGKTSSFLIGLWFCISNQLNVLLMEMWCTWLHRVPGISSYACICVCVLECVFTWLEYSMKV